MGDINDLMVKVSIWTLPLLFAMPFGPMLAWKRGDLAAALQRLWFAAIIALIFWLLQAFGILGSLGSVRVG